MMTAAVLDHAFLESARHALRERLQEQLYTLLDTSSVDAAGKLRMPLAAELPLPALALPHSGLYAFVGSNHQTDWLWHSPSAKSLQLPQPLSLEPGQKYWSELQMAEDGDYLLLGYGFQRTVKTGVYAFNFFLMAELAPLHQQIAAYRQQLWGGLAVAVVLLVLIQLWLIRWGLKPLRLLASELNDIEQGMTHQITGRYPREVKHLTDNINHLLTQERAQQIQYRNALDDLAHSLKTPLAVLSVAVKQPETLADTVNEQTCRMLGIVERQLQRATAVKRVIHTSPINVFQVLERLISSLSKVYRDKNLNIINQVSPNLYARFDEADLMEMLGNLLDNACKWSQATIEIQGYRTAQRLLIVIEDDGPGIADSDVLKIMQRGGRVDELTAGHGFGLSIAAEIVAAYQGQCRIESSHLGGAAIYLEFLDWSD